MLRVDFVHHAVEIHRFERDRAGAELLRKHFVPEVAFASAPEGLLAYT